MPKHTLFIADLHLSEEKATTTEIFLRFLQTEAPKADALYILGDLFKLWIGDDDRTLYNEKIKAALKELSTKTKIYFLPGNRDFLLGQEFAEESGCILLDDPYKIDLYGIPTLLAHGDLLYTNDKLHMIFRFITRPKWLVKLFLALPFKLRSCMAHAVQRYSAQNKQKKVSNYHTVPQTNIEKLLRKYGTTQIIFGHIHQPTITKWTNDELEIKCITVGTWKDSGSVLSVTEQHIIELQTFP